MKRKSGIGASGEVKKGRPPKFPPCDVILEELIEVKVDGESICDMFIELPNKKEYPEYYEVIDEPICINDIKKQVKKMKREDMERLIQQMVNNAKTFNEPGSFVYQQAELIEEHFYRISGLPPPKSSEETNLEMEEEFQEELDELIYKRVPYKPGDFIYFLSAPDEDEEQENEDNEEELELSIGMVHKIYLTKQNKKKIYIRHFLFPQQLQSQKKICYDQQVFCTDYFKTYAPADLNGKCLVLFIDEYINGRPFEWNRKDDQQDVYLCESKFKATGRQKIEKFKDIKQWLDIFPEEVREERQDWVMVPFDKKLELAKIDYSQKEKKVKNKTKTVATDKQKPKKEVGEVESDEEYVDDEEEDEEYQQPRYHMPPMPKRGRPLKYQKPLPAQQQQLQQQFSTMKRGPYKKTLQRQMMPNPALPQPPSASASAMTKMMPQLQYARFIKTSLDEGVVDLFKNKKLKMHDASGERIEKKEILWYSSPPLFIAKPSQPLLSPAYLEFIKDRKEVTKPEVSFSQKIEIRKQNDSKVEPAIIEQKLKVLEDALNQESRALYAAL